MAEKRMLRIVLALRHRQLARASRRRSGRRSVLERGQALVEAAIVMPLMVFIILGVIQLVMMQHARIMTEYAAFNACRAGIVWNADPGVMQSAAIISLMPTYQGMFDESDLGNPMGMVRKIVQRALIYQVHRRLPEAIDLLRSGTDQIVDALGGGSQIEQARDKLLDAIEGAADKALINSINGALGGSPDDMVAIQIVEPKRSNFGLRGSEIDFDDPHEFEHSRLSIKVRYLYMMRVPFANWTIHQAWLAGEAGQQLYGAVWNAQYGAAGRGETGFRTVQSVPKLATAPFHANRKVLQMVAKLGDAGIYMVPLYSTYTMRMQSNPYRASIDMGSGDIGGR
ncbi:MAG TPA: TadE family protein [Polyangia bacterium]|jgi:hypothetical protein